ncbi:hypothetical protein OROGR_023730 [Orobanche gracilis]
MTTRRMRGFRRWMKIQGIDCSDALELIDEGEGGNDGVWVKALCDLREGDLVATIPKQSCLTMKTSGARQLIDDAGLDGYLGLSVALMYEKSLGANSPWFAYLQILPQFEPIPLLWSFEELHNLLSGTELHKIVVEDRALINEDWKECIEPLLYSAIIHLNPDDFSVQQYLMAKSLIASRSFEIDDFHGFGMVPLADLFNHKTNAEDIHFTSVSSYCETDNDSEISDDESDENDEPDKTTMDDGVNSKIADSPAVLQLIIVKDVESGAEVFNTYGSMGNAALLHRYGFTEADNPYDIVNIDLEQVIHWSSSLFSSRYIRTRIALWRKLDYSGSLAQSSDYFEISSDGEPEIELLILLYMISISEEAYNDLDLRIANPGTSNKLTDRALLSKEHFILERGTEISKKMLLTKPVRSALIAVADFREDLYGSRSLDDDMKALDRCSRHVEERKLYHSLVLRTSERKILRKLRAYASAGNRSELKKKRRESH